MTVLQSLDAYYERMAARNEVVAPGWSTEPIGLTLVLGRDGSLRDVERSLESSGKKQVPKRERVPKWFGRSGTASTPFFLWENTAYALGVSAKDPAKTARDHAAFREFHLAELAGVEDEGLAALWCFIESWMPNQFVAPLFDEKMLALNLAFRLDGQHGFIHERPAAVAHVERLRQGKAGEAEGLCLVTGARSSLVRLHPKIKGVEGTASAEVPLVSFNVDAFESYGHKQGANAPTSEAAAFRYGAALNALLGRGSSRNRVLRPIGDATVVFWADASEVGEEAAAAAEETAASMVDPGRLSNLEDDSLEAAKLDEKLALFAAGRPLKQIDPRLEPGTRFHVLGLSPNAARLSVRFWIVDDFAAFGRKLAEHYADVAIEPRPRGWGKPPSVQRLLVKTTALQEKFENIPHQLAGEVMRAVLTGAPYPRTLLAAAVTRLRAGDGPGSGWHGAVIKAHLNRAVHFRNPKSGDAQNDKMVEETIRKEELPVALEPDNKNAAYQLGRLFAVMEAAQYAALGRVNASIGDRFYSAASATPARVFGTLLRGLKTHVSDAKKRGKGKWIEGKVGEIMLKLPADLPRTLLLEDQGRFAVGYYHERATRPSTGGQSDQDEEGAETND